MKYPKYIMETIRQRFGLEPNDTSRDDEIEIMTPREVFTEWLEWQGIIGYSGNILQVIEDVFEIELND